MAAAEPILIDVPTSALRVIETRSDPVIAEAQSLVVDSQEAYEHAATFLRGCKALQKEINDETSEAVRKAHEAHKAMTALRAKHLKPLEEAEKVVKRKMGSFVEEQERAAREAKRLAEAEARKIAEEQAIREAEELEARGMPEAAEERVSAPIILPAVKEAPKPVAEGTSSRKRFSAKVVSLETLVKAAAEGRIPAGLVIANQSALDSLARSLGESFSIPGVEIQAETVISAKGR